MSHRDVFGRPSGVRLPIPATTGPQPLSEAAQRAVLEAEIRDRKAQDRKSRRGTYSGRLPSDNAILQTLLAQNARPNPYPTSAGFASEMINDFNIQRLVHVLRESIRPWHDVARMTASDIAKAILTEAKTGVGEGAIRAHQNVALALRELYYHIQERVRDRTDYKDWTVSGPRVDGILQFRTEEEKKEIADRAAYEARYTPLVEALNQFVRDTDAKETHRDEGVRIAGLVRSHLSRGEMRPEVAERLIQLFTSQQNIASTIQDINRVLGDSFGEAGIRAGSTVPHDIVTEAKHPFERKLLERIAAGGDLKIFERPADQVFDAQRTVDQELERVSLPGRELKGGIEGPRIAIPSARGSPRLIVEQKERSLREDLMARAALWQEMAIMRESKIDRSRTLNWIGSQVRDIGNVIRGIVTQTISRIQHGDPATINVVAYLVFGAMTRNPTILATMTAYNAASQLATFASRYEAVQNYLAQRFPVQPLSGPEREDLKVPVPEGKRAPFGAPRVEHVPNLPEPPVEGPPLPPGPPGFPPPPPDPDPAGTAAALAADENKRRQKIKNYRVLLTGLLGYQGAKMLYKLYKNGEYHLYGYNFLGPGTRFYDRIHGKVPGAGTIPYWIPIDLLDEIAFRHDLGYMVNNPFMRAIADRRMLAEMEELHKKYPSNWLAEYSFAKRGIQAALAAHSAAATSEQFNPYLLEQLEVIIDEWDSFKRQADIKVGPNGIEFHPFPGLDVARRYADWVDKVDQFANEIVNEGEELDWYPQFEVNFEDTEEAKELKEIIEEEEELEKVAANVAKATEPAEPIHPTVSEEVAKALEPPPDYTGQLPLPAPFFLGGMQLPASSTTGEEVAKALEPPPDYTGQLPLPAPFFLGGIQLPAPPATVAEVTSAAIEPHPGKIDINKVLDNVRPFMPAHSLGIHNYMQDSSLHNKLEYADQVLGLAPSEVPPTVGDIMANVPGSVPIGAAVASAGITSVGEVVASVPGAIPVGAAVASAAGGGTPEPIPPSGATVGEAVASVPSVSGNKMIEIQTADGVKFVPTPVSEETPQTTLPLRPELMIPGTDEIPDPDSAEQLAIWEEYQQVEPPNEEPNNDIFIQRLEGEERFEDVEYEPPNVNSDGYLQYNAALPKMYRSKSIEFVKAKKIHIPIKPKPFMLADVREITKIGFGTAAEFNGLFPAAAAVYLPPLQNYLDELPGVPKIVSAADQPASIAVSY